MTMTTESTPTLDTWLSRQGACSDACAWAAAYPATRDEDTVISAEEWRKALLAL